MEVKNNNHPSLPSNYVTLAQLQQRWLSKQKQKDNEKEKENEKEKKLQQQQKQKQKQPLTNLPHHNNPREYRQGQRPKAPQPTWRAISPHAAVKPSPEKSTPKNPDVAVEAEIGDGNGGHDGRKKKWNKYKKKVKRKPRAEDATESSTVVENIEVSNCDFKRTDEKTETEIEKKISLNSEHEKQNSKVKTKVSGDKS